MRLGVLGGSFDPVHYGHLLMAELAREQFALDRVWFIPALISPHKQHDEPAPAEHRARMLDLALAENPALELSRLELERGGVSYTADTLERLHALDGEADLFLILGADSLADLPTWRNPRRICELSSPIVAARPGAPEPDYSVLANLVAPDRLARFSELRLDMPLIDLSSTEIRRRIAAGKSIRYQTPPAVVRYIDEQRLYRIG